MDQTCERADLIPAYLAGELAEHEARSFEEHLASCPNCADAVEAFEAVSRRMPALGGRGGLTEDCLDPETLAAYADGSLDGPKRGAAERHLAVCERCLSEVADLWREAAGATLDVSNAAVDRVIERLRGQTEVALVRWAGATLSVLRGFAEEADRLTGSRDERPQPAIAGVRDAGEQRASLFWDNGRGTSLRCSVELRSGRPVLLGQFTGGAEALARISVSLTTAEGGRGPESPDAGGRFGPWPLGTGRNTLSLSGGGIGPTPLELGIELDRTGE